MHTGGVKCEKASAYLLEKGFQNVYQLYGGIIQYGLETNGEYFEGKCYVFDNRLAIKVNKKNPTVIGSCYVCHATCDRMVNCANPEYYLVFVLVSAMAPEPPIHRSTFFVVGDIGHERPTNLL
jgi:predicted sulfurtransferase